MLPMPAGMTEDQLGYDQVARLTGDYIDQEITYYNKTANEKYTFIVDNPFCWVMDSAPWNETGEKGRFEQLDRLQRIYRHSRVPYL